MPLESLDNKLLAGREAPGRRWRRARLMRMARIMAPAALAIAAGAIPAGAQQWMMHADAQPRRVAADGRATSQITVTVSSAQTGPAPDGTEVRFNTTSGSIIPVARLTAGKATAVLTSGTTPSIAQVTVFVGSSSTTAEVEFVAGDVQVKEIVLQAEGDIAYSVDRGLLIGADTTLTHGDLSISAATVEFEEQVGQVRAQGDVAVSSGGSMIHADALWYSPENEAGAVLIAGPSPLVVSFRSGLLKLSAPIPALDLQAFELFKPDNTRTWITAERATIWPRERIQFTQAVVSIGGRDVLALPHYFYEYQGTGLNPISQQFRYTEYEGMVLDLPFYFMFRKQQSAGVRLRYAGRGSSYGGFATPRKGFSLGLEHIYNASGGGGKLFVDDFPSRDRSLEWTHDQTLSGARRLNASLRYQPISEFSRNAVSGFASYGWRTAGLDMTLAAYGSRSNPREDGTADMVDLNSGALTARLDARTPSREIGHTGLSWRASAALVNGPLSYNSSTGTSTGFYQTLGVGIARRPIALPLKSSLTLTTDIGQSVGAFSSTSIRGRAAWSKSLGRSGHASVSWDQEFLSGRTLSSPYRKSLTASVSAGSAGGLRAYSHFVWIPDDSSHSLQLTATKPLGKLYRLQFSHSFSGAGYTDQDGRHWNSSYRYSKLSLSRQLGLLDLTLSWSPQGRDYGLNRGKKLWLEIGSRAF